MSEVTKKHSMVWNVVYEEPSNDYSMDWGTFVTEKGAMAAWLEAKEQVAESWGDTRYNGSVIDGQVHLYKTELRWEEAL